VPGSWSQKIRRVKKDKSKSIGVADFVFIGSVAVRVKALTETTKALYDEIISAWWLRKSNKLTVKKSNARILKANLS